MEIYKPLKEKILTKKAVITVIGLGYVGLPIALEFYKKGYNVNGLESSEARVKKLNDKISYINDIPSSLIAKAISGKKKLKVTSDTNILTGSDAIIVCVPTPLRKVKEPDISFIVKISKTLSATIRRGQIIILESTTYPGTTRDLILPILEKSGLKVNEDFYLAFSPERIDPGNPKYHLTNIPKLLGGLNDKATEIGKLLYSRIINNVIGLSSPESAEVTKLLENTFRIVNIGLINEFATLCSRLKIDVWEVIEAAATKPFGFMKFEPGPGIGGHCIPADPMYLSWKARKVGFETKMIDLAAKVNRNVPKHIVMRISEILNGKNLKINGAKIFLIGVTYKKDVNDLRESPAIDIIHILSKRGAKWAYHDKYIPYLALKGLKSKSLDIAKKTLNDHDLVVILADHSYINYKDMQKNSKLIFDTRNILGKNGIKGPNVIKL